MTTKLLFDFDGFDDFDDWLDEHEEIINAMGSSEVNDSDLTEQMRMSVQANEQLPEFFEFTNAQLKTMYQREPRGMKSLMEDKRVTVQKPESDNDG